MPKAPPDPGTKKDTGVFEELNPVKWIEKILRKGQPPAEPAEHKIKKTSGEPAPIALVPTDDVLAGLVADPPRAGQVVVGFAAETGDASGDVLHHGREKARRKGAHLLVVNAVGGGRGFGAETNEVTILDRAGDVVGRAAGTKDDVADAVWDAVVRLLDVDA